MAMKLNMHLVGKIAIALAATLLSLVVLEVGARWIVVTDPGLSSLYRVPHPVFGWVLEPRASYRNTFLVDAPRVTYNSRGWRDVEHDFEKPPGVFRILVLGDSFMEAYSVELNEAFHRRIAGLAKADGLNVETINLGVGGYGTLQQYLVFREVGRRYDPDLVLLGFHPANDVRDNSIALERLVTEGLKVDSRPFLAMSSTVDWTITQPDFEGARHRYIVAKARRDSFPQRLVRQYASIRATGDAINKIRNFGRSQTVGDGQALGNEQLTVRNDIYPTDPTNYPVSFCKEPPEVTSAWAATSRILDRLETEIRQTGAEFAVFSVPAIQNVSPGAIRLKWIRPDDPSRLCLAEAPSHRRLKTVLDELGVHFINLLPALREAHSKNAWLYGADFHWNAAGHELAAETVSEYLEAHNMVPAEGQVR
jgi:lysophospholipase L1-like esterase